MATFTLHQGTVVPLRRSEIDTDQIIPGRFCKRVGRAGYADALFGNWRTEPGYILDRPQHHGASILATGPNFGIGSSREHAVWALQDHGFRAIVAPSFSDIFRGNALGCGLLPVQVPFDVVDFIWRAAEADPGFELTVDLERCEVRDGADVLAPFPVDGYSRHKLLHGLDDIGVTLGHSAEIDAYEDRRRPWLPRTLPLP